MKKRVIFALIATLMFAVSTGLAQPPGGDNCNPDGYIHYCASFCGYCSNYGGCCKSSESPNQYCLEVFGHVGTGCHDGFDDGCCGSEGLF